jgi:hypothetical protein
MAGGNSGLPTDQNLYSAVAGFTVTPSDTTVFASTHRALWIGAGGGNITVRMVRDGSILAFNAIPAGTMMPLSVDMVKATGTTATDIVAVR